MSLWFRRKDKQGRVHYFSVTIPLCLIVVAILAILLAVLLPLLQWVRQCLR